MFRAMWLLGRGLPKPLRAGPNDDERGQTLVEYALLLFFIAIVVIAALVVLGPTISGIFQSVNDQIP